MGVDLALDGRSDHELRHRRRSSISSILAMTPKRTSSPIDRLRRVAAALDALGDDDVAWLVAGIREYEMNAAEGARLDEALDLVPRAGESPWWLEEAQHRRDDTLRELAAMTAASAGQMAEMISRYAASNWPRDRSAKTTPARYVGTAKEWLFRAFQAGNGRVPSSPKHLRRILSGGTSNTTFHAPGAARISLSDEEHQCDETNGPEFAGIYAGPSHE